MAPSRSRSSAWIFSFSAIFASSSCDFHAAHGGAARVFVKLLLVLLELRLGHAAAEVVLHETAQHLLRLRGDEALRQRKLDAGGQRLAHLLALRAAVLVFLALLQVLRGPAPERVETLHLLAP